MLELCPGGSLGDRLRAAGPLQVGRSTDRPLPDPGPAELAEAAEDVAMVRAAVAALPPGRRAGRVAAGALPGRDQVA